MRRHRSRAAMMAATIIATTALAGLGGVAHAAAPPELLDEGLWYYSGTGVAEAHQRTTGAGITIAILDTPINPGAADLVGADLQVKPSLCLPQPGAPTNEVSTAADAEHATAVSAVLIGTGAGSGGQRGTQGVAPGATVLHYSTFPLGWVNDPSVERPECLITDPPKYAASIDQAVADGADIISMSLGGIFLPADGRALARAMAAGVIIVGGAANEGGALQGAANLNGAVAVEAFDAAGALDDSTTESEFLTVVAPGEDVRIPTPGPDGSWGSYRLASGTSYATPWVAGVLALGWSLYPEATANQMIQSLIRNTATDGTELAHDEQWGYGAVSVTRFLDADPTQYPDENPLIRDREDELDMPPTSVILAAIEDAAPPVEATEPPADPTTGPTAEDSPAADDSDASDAATDEEGGSPLPLVLGGAALLLVAAVAVALAARRRSQPSPDR